MTDGKINATAHIGVPVKGIVNLLNGVAELFGQKRNRLSAKAESL